ncbi:hypothetical protein [Rhodococcus sp. IEGM 1379]|uniref:hypothetical protein n=1 Tax=Rhodococcus sp. IEGM 1379 TaxID=3047086 RepID=UPI0024B6EE2A|nr:hypothetical protein [Rhodococcus sp. IEGM 1379]MDI9914392.1 hypothetical protein [Rhodococcus sp. IEGM 1379]
MGSAYRSVGSQLGTFRARVVVIAGASRTATDGEPDEVAAGVISGVTIEAAEDLPSAAMTTWTGEMHIKAGAAGEQGVAVARA